MKLFQRITLALMGCMLLSTPAMAADYSFETKAPADYYGSTAYEEVYGAQYNYGGQNAVDFLDPLADSAPSPLAGPGRCPRSGRDRPSSGGPATGTGACPCSSDGPGGS